MRTGLENSPEEIETIEQKNQKIEEIKLKIADKWTVRSDAGIEEPFPQTEFIKKFIKKYPEVNPEEFEIYHRIVGSSPQREHEFDTPEGLVYSEFLAFAENYLDQEDAPIDGLVS